MFLGLDVGKTLGSYYCIKLEDGKTTLDEGAVTLSKFAEMLAKHKPKAIALEYTGRLAEPYIEIATELGTPVYIMHSTDRKSLNRIARQKAKTDPEDARGLARNLCIWLDPIRREMALYSNDLFIDASSVRIAWQLRALLSSVETLT